MAFDIKDPRTQKSILGGMALAAILYFYFFTSLLPITYKANASQVAELETKYRSLSKDLNKARNSTHSLPYLEKEYELLQRKWQQTQALLPEQQDMAWLLRTITLLGTQSGVEFTLFRPLAAKPAQYHTEHPIEVKVVGGYHQVGAFLAELANLDRIINVSDLTMLTNRENDPEKPVEASFVAGSYTLGGTGVAPEDPAQDAEKDAKAAKGTKAAKSAKASKSAEKKGADKDAKARGGSRGEGE